MAVNVLHEKRFGLATKCKKDVVFVLCISKGVLFFTIMRILYGFPVHYLKKLRAVIARLMLTAFW